jgi:hypothetical protein
MELFTTDGPIRVKREIGLTTNRKTLMVVRQIAIEYIAHSCHHNSLGLGFLTGQGRVAGLNFAGAGQSRASGSDRANLRFKVQHPVVK